MLMRECHSPVCERDADDVNRDGGGIDLRWRLPTSIQPAI
jgi:hypothetical protein